MALGFLMLYMHGDEVGQREIEGQPIFKPPDGTHAYLSYNDLRLINFKRSYMVGCGLYFCLTVHL